MLVVAGKEKLPDGGTRASKHVGVVEWSNKTQKAHLLVIYRYNNVN
jgi:hypothetical protein